MSELISELWARSYISACADYLGHNGTKVRALDMTAAKRVNTTPQLRTISEIVAGYLGEPLNAIAIVRAVRRRASQRIKREPQVTQPLSSAFLDWEMA